MNFIVPQITTHCHNSNNKFAIHCVTLLTKIFLQFWYVCACYATSKNKHRNFLKHSMWNLKGRELIWVKTIDVWPNRMQLGLKHDKTKELCYRSNTRIKNVLCGLEWAEMSGRLIYIFHIAKSIYSNRLSYSDNFSHYKLWNVFHVHCY